MGLLYKHTAVNRMIFFSPTESAGRHRVHPTSRWFVLEGLNKFTRERVIQTRLETPSSRRGHWPQFATPLGSPIFPSLLLLSAVRHINTITHKHIKHPFFPNEIAHLKRVKMGSKYSVCGPIFLH